MRGGPGRSAMTHVSRGFHRIGVVLALPVLAVAAALTLRAEHEARPPPVCLTRVSVGAEPTAWGRPCRAPYGRGSTSEPRHRVDRVDASTAAGIAVALYMVCRALGWIIDGFRGAT